MPEEPKPTPNSQESSQTTQERPTASASEIQNALNQTSLEQYSERPTLEYRVVTTENNQS